MSATGNTNNSTPNPTAPIGGDVTVLTEREVREMGLEEAPPEMGQSDEELEEGGQATLEGIQ